MIEVNKIYNDDCMKIMKNMEDLSVNLTIADIPFGEVTKQGKDRAKYKGQLRKIDKGNADIVTFNTIDFLKEISRITSGSIYIFCGIEQVSEIFTFFKEDMKKDFMARFCVWKKTNPSPANGQHMWLSGTECIIFAKRRKTVFNQHCKSNVFEFPTERERIHPTQKPLELIKYLIRSSSNEGDIVFDPVCGSGTSCVGAIETNRQYIGIELNKKYYNIAKQRIGELKMA